LARTALILTAAAFLLTVPLCADEPVDLAMMTRIREEGFQRSQVMETVWQLTEGSGPRVNGSPQLKAANEWARTQLEQWGLRNAHLEPYHFGRGWSFSHVAVHMLKPQQVPLLALPKAYAPGTAGPVHGPVVVATLKKESDLEAYRGKLAGKIVLLSDLRDLSQPQEAGPRELSEEGLRDLVSYDIPEPRDPEEGKKVAIERTRFRQARNRFLAEEKALAIVEASPLPWGMLLVGRSGDYDPAHNPGVTSLVMAAEHYNRLRRLVDAGKEVEVEVDVAARFHDDDLNAYNTVAEIPGTDPRGELVMVGAHLDSWHGNTGATDNAAGCAVTMEAMRILSALEVRPRRTIRIALWTGEEVGDLGSNAYVTEHFASWSGPTDPERRALLLRFAWKNEGTLTLRPEHAKLMAYFNMDNGGGRIRGLYAENNVAAQPIFQAWLAPFHDLGADTVTLRSTDSTDHDSFKDVGLPGFQFIQDDLDYFTHTHHSNVDGYDHLDRKNLVQASVVLAGVLYNAAMRPELLPRTPMPGPVQP
jgi:hypothetical protein